jgi:DNA-binding NarL/FixJ family response regulator
MYRVDVDFPPDRDEPLTDSEKQVLGAVAAGLTNQEIAETIFYSLETVKMRIRSIMWKTCTRSRAHAVSWGYQNGVLKVDE